MTIKAISIAKVNHTTWFEWDSWPCIKKSNKIETIEYKYATGTMEHLEGNKLTFYPIPSVISL